MIIDSEMADSSPKRRKEYFQILNSLSYAQTSMKPTENIKLQYKNVETAAQNLSTESLKLAIEVYKAKSMEILEDINILMKSRIKYIPLASKVINYVKPNLSKRRFSDQIIPKVVSEMETLITNLSKRQEMQPALNTNEVIKVPPTNLLPMRNEENSLTIVLTNSGIRNVHTKNNMVPIATPTNNQNMEVNMLESRKRKIQTPTLPPIRDENLVPKRGNKLYKSSSTSSVPKLLQSPISTPDVDAFEVDIDKSPKPANNFKFKQLHNKVKTAEEAFTTYKTFAPSSQVLPSFSNPPDMSKLAVLSENTSDTMIGNIHEICHDTHNNSFPDYSLFTLNSRGHENFPKTHISVKISPTAMSNNVLNTIPENLNFVYEVLLLDHTFMDYKDQLPVFVSWVIEKSSKLIFTVPEMYFTELDKLLPHLNLCEISRPFQAALCSSLIT
jgi:hypothetical protein